MVRSRRLVPENHNDGGNESVAELDIFGAETMKVKRRDLLGQISPKGAAVVDLHELGGN
jgi:hypothetical protein